MKHTFSLLMLLALSWWVLSGHATPLLLALGLASVAFVLWLERRLQRAEGAGHPLQLSWGLLAFWGWLLREIAVANLQVARLVLARRPALSPTLCRVAIRQRTDLGRVVLANAITLTPGTVTLDVDDTTVLVHALTAAGAADVQAGTMDRRVPAGVQDAAPAEPRR